jgi:O-antigen/teichoic acid export membrane protein
LLSKVDYIEREMPVVKVDKRQANVKSRFVSKIANNVIALVSNMIIGFVLPRSLGPSMYGNYTLAYDMISQTVSFLELRSFTFFYNKLSSNYKSRYLVSYTLITIGVILLVGLLVGLVYFSGVDNYFLKGVPFSVALIAMAIVFQKWLLDFFSRIYDASGLTLYSEKYKTAFSLAFILLISCFLLVSSFTLAAFLTFNLIVFVPLLLLLFLKFQKFERVSLFSLYSYRFTFGPILKGLRKYCSPFLLFLTLQLIINLVDRNLLQLKRGSHEQGLYGFSISLTNIILILIAAIIPIFQREVAILNYQKDKAGLCAFYDKVVPSLFMLVCYFVAFIAVNSADVITLIGGNKFQGARYLLMWSMVSTLAACYTNFNNCVLYVTGAFGFTSKLLVYIFPVSLLYSGVVLYYFDFGSIGLVIKNVISEVTMLIFVMSYLSRTVGLNIRKHFFFLIYIFILFSLTALFAEYLCSVFLPDNVLVRLLFKGGLYTLLIGAAYLFSPAVLMIGKDFGNRINMDRISLFAKFKKV